MYAERKRPSIPPETLLKPQILIALSTVWSERLFCERLRRPELVRTAPHTTPVRRLDEARAARQPVLRWRKQR